MALLARRINSPTAWVDAEEDWTTGDFPFEILAELKDGRGDGTGLSLYECNSPEDTILQRIAAAFYFGGDQKKDPQVTTFRFVSTEFLDAVGISYEKTPGATKDLEVNALHFDIKGLNAPKALVLAAELGSSQPKEIKQPAIIHSITEGLRVGRHKKTDAKEGCLVAINKKNGLGFSEDSLVFK